VQLFNKQDPKKLGYIDSKHAIGIFRQAGQNPTVSAEATLIKEAETSAGSGVMTLEDMMFVFERHWKNRETMEMELERSIQAFKISIFECFASIKFP
jgi:Ca2+-binding EF-hand superfamily protein